MRDGAWIRIIDGAWWWIDEHADWMKRRENAVKVGLPDYVWETISNIRNDYSGQRRKSILLTVMEAGFIRMRGYGDSVTFEFTAGTEGALFACRDVLRNAAGELTLCRFNNLTTTKTLELLYRDYLKLIPREIG